MAEKHDREKLIDVALDLRIRQGYEATTIDQIAAAVGVTSPAVGRYFATKDAIILSIVDDIVVAVATELAQMPPQTSPPEARSHPLSQPGSMNPQGAEGFSGFVRASGRLGEPRCGRRSGRAGRRLSGRQSEMSR